MEAQQSGQYAFYCSALLHTINPTSQWNCPGNSLNYSLIPCIQNASHHFQRVQAAPVHRTLSGGPRSTKGGRSLDATKPELWPSGLPEAWVGRRGLSGQVGAWWFPLGAQGP